MISISNPKNSLAFTIPVLIFSFIILTLPYILDWKTIFGVTITIGYFVLCIVLWTISLSLLVFEERYVGRIMEKNSNLPPRVIAILIITGILITMGTLIASVTGAIISSETYLSPIYIALGYLLGVIMVLPALWYFSLFLYYTNQRRAFYLFTVINLIILGGVFIWFMNFI